jgi:hypothetical protein
MSIEGIHRKTGNISSIDFNKLTQLATYLVPAVLTAGFMSSNLG